MYLISCEGSVYKTEFITHADLKKIDIGLLTIVDLKSMTEYYNNRWHEIAEWEEFEQ